MFNFNNGPGCGNRNGQCAEPCCAGDFEALQNARKDLIGELDAIIQYDDHLHKTDNKLAKETWENIRDEELMHVGELLGLLFCLAPYQKEYVEKGLDEFNDRVSKCRC